MTKHECLSNDEARMTKRAARQKGSDSMNGEPQLSEQDVLELLGYANAGRRPLEIIGFGYSTAGMQQFLRERPRVLPQVLNHIVACLNEFHRYPRVPREDEGTTEGPPILRCGEMGVTMEHTVETGVSRYARVISKYPSAVEAVAALVRLRADLAFLDPPQHCSAQE
jgi:hypothetical protein